MPRPRERTRSKRRINRPLPGGKKGTAFRGKTATLARCSLCGQRLTGLLSTSSIRAGSLNRGKRRIWRPYGGQLCHNCLKTALKRAART